MGVQRSPLLARYRAHPALQQRLGSQCQVRLCFGLHFGWAIEGAVGSDYKIDASYLSPNVTIAESLERATKVYRVHIIVSETVVALCTESMAAKCRLIDKVMLGGSKVPLELHSLDLDTGLLPVQQRMPPLTWNMRERFRARQVIEIEKRRIMADDIRIASVFDMDEDLALMRRSFSVEFFQVFNMGYRNYSEGEWEVARRLLMRTPTMFGFTDGPSGALLAFMETPHHFQVPDGWRGV